MNIKVEELKELVGFFEMHFGRTCGRYLRLADEARKSEDALAAANAELERLRGGKKAR